MLPAGIALDVEDRETVFAAARRHGYRWPTICQGQGTCRTCFVDVTAGAEHCSPVQAFEAEGLTTLGRLPGLLRLACQLQVTGPVSVVKRGVRPENQEPS